METKELVPMSVAISLCVLRIASHQEQSGFFVTFFVQVVEQGWIGVTWKHGGLLIDFFENAHQVWLPLFRCQLGHGLFEFVQAFQNVGFQCRHDG